MFVQGAFALRFFRSHAQRGVDLGLTRAQLAAGVTRRWRWRRWPRWRWAWRNGWARGLCSIAPPVSGHTGTAHSGTLRTQLEHYYLQNVTGESYLAELSELGMGAARFLQIRLVRAQTDKAIHAGVAARRAVLLHLRAAGGARPRWSGRARRLAELVELCFVADAFQVRLVLAQAQQAVHARIAARPAICLHGDGATRG